MFRKSISIIALAAIAICNIGPIESNPMGGSFIVGLKNISVLKKGQTKVFETFYQAEILIGTPPMKYLAMFDLNSADTIALALDKNLAFTLNSSGFYRPDQSATSQLIGQGAGNYKGQSFNGEIYKDQFAIESLDQQTHSLLMNFLAANEVQKFMTIDDFLISSIIGLSPRYESSTGNLGFLASLKSAELINELQFSISFKGKDQEGQILFGAPNNKLYEGELTSHKIISTKQWALSLKPIIFGSQIVGCSLSECAAILSTTVKDIYGPAHIVKDIHESLGAVIKDGLPILPNDTVIANLPILTLVIDGKQYTYPPQQYVNHVEQENINVKYVGIMADDHTQNKWTLGRDFLSMYYTAYNVSEQTVSIAPMPNHE